MAYWCLLSLVFDISLLPHVFELVNPWDTDNVNYLPNLEEFSIGVSSDYPPLPGEVSESFLKMLQQRRDCGSSGLTMRSHNCTLSWLDGIRKELTELIHGGFNLVVFRESVEVDFSREKYDPRVCLN